MRPYRTIIVGARTQYAVKVDAEDYDFLMQWPWTYAVLHPRHGGLVYARRSVREGDRNVTVLMHRVIILERMKIERPSLKHFVDHENGDSLDNRRVNDEEPAAVAMADPAGKHGQPAWHPRDARTPGLPADVVGHSVLT